MGVPQIAINLGRGGGAIRQLQQAERMFVEGPHLPLTDKMR